MVPSKPLTIRTGRAYRMEIKDERIAIDAILLIQRAWGGYDISHGAGFMSCAIYDTAWISMVAKDVAGKKQWLFPQSFDYLISTQSDDGSWGATTTSQIDGILNTAASLLSLQKHRLEPLNTTDYALEGVERRMRRATESLASQLKSWDVAATAHVGFEIIVPALLKLLRAENSLTVFDFAGEQVLRRIHTAKMSGFKPESLYGRQPSTALHSLEAFNGKLDFDKLVHHKASGSMMGSPSSTAAYLVYASNWDNEAEAYLRHVVQASVGKSSGAVPSAFPSMFFEYTWILSTMLRAGFSVADFRCAELEAMVRLLEHAFEQGQGTIGFAPGIPADVDDTAKCIVCLSRLGREASPTGMIDAFEVDTHFRTYATERNPSFTANCNVLSALLEQPDLSRYSTQILKIVDFLCHCWWESDGSIKDKWNLSSLYPSLLVVQAVVDLLIQIERGNLEPLSQAVQSQVHITLFQACLRALLRNPQPRSIEQTAYRVLILCEARRLPFFDPIRPQIDEDIKDQVSLLSSMPDSELESDANRVWVEKVSFGSQLLTQSYKLAALKAASCLASRISLESGRHHVSSLESGRKYVKLLKQTPLFASTPEWQVQASMLEASLFQPLLRRRRLDIFPRKDMAPDQYFDLIPLTWTSCNNRASTYASTHFIFEMMVISFLDFQADEFMEAVAGPSFEGRIGSLRKLIDDVFNTVEEETLAEMPNKPVKISNATRGNSTNGMNDAASVTGNVLVHKNTDYSIECNGNHDELRGALTRFVSHISRHPSVQSASIWDRNSTLRELQTYLHAHSTQSEDNARLAWTRSSTRQLERARAGLSPPTQITGRESYFQWVHTTSSAHTACPYSFAFAGCLLSTQFGGIESFPTTQAKYLAAAACQHLATMCRMYNDYGSIARDEAECNLNSLDFAEFTGAAVANGVEDGNKDRYGDDSVLQAKKKTLYELAQYERSWLRDTMRRLGEKMQGSERRRQMEIWTMFCDVTDLYGQIYVVKDVASRMTNEKTS